MIAVFVAGPIGYRKEGDERRPDVSRRADEALEVAAELLRRGYVPIVPHLSIPWLRRSVWFGGRPSDETWARWAIELLDRSDAVIRLPGPSTGAEAEAAYARAHGIPVFHSLEELEAVARLAFCGGGGDE